MVIARHRLGIRITEWTPNTLTKPSFLSMSLLHMSISHKRNNRKRNICSNIHTTWSRHRWSRWFLQSRLQCKSTRAIFLSEICVHINVELYVVLTEENILPNTITFKYTSPNTITFVNFICQLCLWTFFVNFVCELYLWTFFVNFIYYARR